MGKTVMCLPTRINEESICNRIIKEGAFLVENSEDIELCLSKSFF
jgi:predicted Rossmann fold nucleotide-binding protein DprA/Smf involved in DNA uptake